MTDTPPVADTPVRAPPSRADVVKGFIGDLARPFAIWATASTTAWAIVDPRVDAGKLTAAGLILTALYAGKVIENQTQARQAASVEIAKAQAPPAAVDTGGELPASQRVRP
jgi:hypothetical protein